MAVAAAGFAGEGVLCGAIPPGLVTVCGEAGLTVGACRKVFALTNRVYLISTPT